MPSLGLLESYPDFWPRARTEPQELPGRSVVTTQGSCWQPGEDAVVTCLPVAVSFTGCADIIGQEQLGNYRLATSVQCHKPGPAWQAALRQTGMVGQAPPYSTNKPWWKAGLISCNSHSYQQAMLSPLWKHKVGVLPLWGPGGSCHQAGSLLGSERTMAACH